MKKILLSVTMAVGVLLGGCTTVTLEQIQAAAVAACGFLPTAVQVSSLFPSLNTYTGTAAPIAEAICSAVVAQVPKAANRHALRMGAAQGAVNVTVTLPNGNTAVVSGYFVK
jgi:ABC-type spermidine/putrescine transport system permease subunit II